jgi:crossover junction endodeoxyribonuclease RuvC
MTQPLIIPPDATSLTPGGARLQLGDNGCGAEKSANSGSGEPRPITTREAESQGRPPAVIGLDLSLTCTGVAGNGWTRALKPPADLDGMRRLHWLREHIIDCCRPWDLVVIEGYAYARSNGQAAAGELSGIIRYALWRRDIPFIIVQPSSVKKYATGNGNAAKDAMLGAAYKRLPGFDGGNDEADAAWLRAMALDALGWPLVTMPAANRAALGKVDWPELVAS